MQDATLWIGIGLPVLAILGLIVLMRQGGGCLTPVVGK